jgi:hypothetical protein
MPDMVADLGWVHGESLPVPCYYKAGGFKDTFEQAMNFCKNAFVFGGVRSHLTTISSEQEAKFVVGAFGGPGKPHWVGAVRDNNGSPWYNIDGTFFSERLFYDGEPNGGYNTAQMGYGKKGDDKFPWKLNDANSQNKIRFTCEWCPPETETSTTTVAPTTTTSAEPTSTRRRAHNHHHGRAHNHHHRRAHNHHDSGTKHDDHNCRAAEDTVPTKPRGRHGDERYG